jgi:hypothetical protein
MTATPRMIRELRQQGRMPIDPDLEALILQEYGSEPYPYTYTEQDLHEQIRKLILQYNPGSQTRPDDEEPNGGCL